MDDATLNWVNEVNAAHGEADSLNSDVERLQHELNDLVHTIRDLAAVRFADDVEDYEIREHARQLWESVSGAVGGIRSQIQTTASDVNDLRRVVDFHSR